MKRNKENEGKKRPICVCGTEMTFINFKGYYEELEFWLCESNKCLTDANFKPDDKQYGAYTR